jgi:hypothetical protein
MVQNYELKIVGRRFNNIFHVPICVYFIENHGRHVIGLVQQRRGFNFDRSDYHLSRFEATGIPSS